MEIWPLHEIKDFVSDRSLKLNHFIQSELHVILTAMFSIIYLHCLIQKYEDGKWKLSNK